MRDPGWEGVPESLLRAKVDWLVELDDAFVHHAFVNGERWTLRVNDFPDEVMFSLFQDGDLVAQFDN